MVEKKCFGISETGFKSFSALCCATLGKLCNLARPQLENRGDDALYSAVMMIKCQNVC